VILHEIWVSHGDFRRYLYEVMTKSMSKKIDKQQWEDIVHSLKEILTEVHFIIRILEEIKDKKDDKVHVK